MKIGIGILAWNESGSIEATISSIFDQSLMEELGQTIDLLEVLCVPNGCTDDTAEVAESAFNQLGGSFDSSLLQTRVVPVEKPSKENAWNVFVHELSHRECDYLILVDGDVRILHPDTLKNLVVALENDAEARIAGAATVKHITYKRWKSPFDLLSLAVSGLRHQRRGGFAGALYCARAKALRAFILPSILVGEDSFINAMIGTDYFTNRGKPTRTIQPENATVLFEAYTAPLSVLKNLRRRGVEIAIDSMIYDVLWSQSTPEKHGGALLREWESEDLGWGSRLVEEKIKERGWWVMTRGMLWKWFKRAWEVGGLRRWKMMPIAVIATLPHIYACCAANRLIRRRAVGNLWFETETTSLNS